MRHLIKIPAIIFFLVSPILVTSSCKKEEVPTVVTSAVTNIDATTAVSGGEITIEGSGTVTKRGVCWSKEIDPTIDDNFTTNGAGVGSYESEITNLTPATSYYLRAYAKNEAGIGYGMVVAFTTQGQVPDAVTHTPTNISTTSATLNGTVNANYILTTVMFEYGLTPSYGSTVTLSQGSVTGSSNVDVACGITFLLPGTTYHFRIKTTNSLGTAYGDDMGFTTLGQAPVATTQEASHIGTSVATLNASVNANDLSTLVSFEYGLTTSYGSSTVISQSPITGNLPINLSSTLSELQLGTIYHFRVRAENSLGITYGEDLSFTTSSIPSLPVVMTAVISPISPTTATGGGNVTSDGGLRISNKGVCWSIYPNPTIEDIHTSDGTGTGPFNSNLGSLTPNTTYHVRAYASNSDGISYGQDREFATDPLTVSDIDGNSYDVVRIGTQLWLKQNLRTTTLNDNTVISLVANSTSWSNLLSPGYCLYNSEEDNKRIYGALYNWYAVNSGKLCLAGWHVATDNDWLTMKDFLGGELFAGGKLKETGTSHWASPNTGATDEYDFTALPGGWRTDNGTFQGMRSMGYWWTSTPNSINAWYRHVQNDSEKLFRVYADPNFGMSVRCLKNN